MVKYSCCRHCKKAFSPTFQSAHCPICGDPLAVLDTPDDVINERLNKPGVIDGRGAMFANFKGYEASRGRYNNAFEVVDTAEPRSKGYVNQD